MLDLNEEIQLSPEWEVELQQRLADVDAGRVDLVRSEDVTVMHAKRRPAYWKERV